MRYILFVLILLVILFTASIFSGFPSQAAPPPTPTADIPEIAIEVNLDGSQLPTFQVLSTDNKPGETVHITPKVVHLPKDLLPINAQVVQPKSESVAVAGDGLVDNWQLLLEESFEDGFPDYPTCYVFDKPKDGYARTWDEDDFKPYGGNYAGWPGKGGLDGVDPAWNNYPANLGSGLRCGPFTLSQAQDFLVRFDRWMEIYDPDDTFFVGVSTDWLTYTGITAYGVSDWVKYNAYFNGLEGEPEVLVLWMFDSDSDGNQAQGVWMDNLEVWRYLTPNLICGNLDPGNKGLVLPPYDPTAGLTVPIIRAGDTIALHQAAAVGANWVRLGFIQRNGVVDRRAYDRMVDSLCAKGISVLGLVNDETLARQDFNNSATAAAYRQEFAATVSSLVKHFEGRIKYWEVWNEPNYDPSGGGQQPPFIAPERYAPLLNDTYNAIKSANSQAQVLFGGLASPWNDSRDYFVQVYDRLDINLGGARPFNYFALHPYPNIQYGPNPSVYMYADLGYTTIVDKFLETMAGRNDGNKKIWVTEAGWNSAKGSSNRPVCHDPVLVTESEQAAYLKPLFDALFNEVKLWNNPGISAVDKVIWYQYMDVGITDPCISGNGLIAHSYAPAKAILPAGNGVDWWFGLYRGDKVSTKPVWCEFRSYPLTCSAAFSNKTYLPLVLKNQ